MWVAQKSQQLYTSTMGIGIRTRNWYIDALQVVSMSMSPTPPMESPLGGAAIRPPDPGEQIKAVVSALFDSIETQCIFLKAKADQVCLVISFPFLTLILWVIPQKNVLQLILTNLGTYGGR
jgi:hypothetical protein